MCALVLALMAMPALGQEEGVEPLGRWDPSGTYIVIDEEGSCVTPGTMFLTQFVPADNAMRHYLIMQNRLNNIQSTHVMEYLTVRGDMWRTGPNSFVWSSILYTPGWDGEPFYSFVNTGRMVRRPNGEIWAEDMYFFYYWGDQNPLDPEVTPFYTDGPCSMPAVSKLEYVPPPEE
jgi:hypothetical protein